MADDMTLEAVIRMGEKDTVPDKEPTVYPDTTLDPADAMPR